jgi:GH15 family glucan-1,4-alpha-glucosidase
MGHARIEDYAMIGDCESAALVGRDGSIDWLCWPRFDSPACFAALLGDAQHGRWKIGCEARTTKRRYRPDTLILETDFETDTGAVTLVDFMPLRGTRSDLVRTLVGRRGRVAMEMEFILRFDYGASVPWVTRFADGNGIRAISGPDKVVLCAPVPLENRDMRTRARFEVEAGQTLSFVLTYGPSHLEIPQPVDPSRALGETERYWRDWTGRCTATGPWAPDVRRSLITLKALTYAPTGGMVAAPTTSLPERIGGVRNWDYRCCWLRDATLTLLALMYGGFHDEARPEQMQILYGIAGERRLPEWDIGWLPGYENSRPVRVGNAAAAQMQLDVYGEVIDALYQACRVGLARHDVAWGLQGALLAHLEKVWVRPDEGIWEVRGPPRHFTYSKIMAWVAFDRAVKMVEGLGLPGPVERWRELRDRIHRDVCEGGYSTRRRAFVQSYGAEELDAALLLIPITGFLPASDPRVLSTVEAIQRELTVEGLVQRYLTYEALDGLPQGEGVFLACSFWLADNLCLQGRHGEARELFERLLGLANDVGLLAEEYDPVARRFLGNFPQAFSHVALVNTALNLGQAEKPAEQRAEQQRAA